jgi:hypothetical protein
VSTLLIAGGLLVDELSVRHATLVRGTVVWQDGAPGVAAGHGQPVTR